MQLCLGLAVLGAVTSVVLVWAMFFVMMVEELKRVRNTDLVAGEGGPFSRLMDIYRSYRSEVPKGGLHRQAWAICALGVVGLIAMAAMLPCGFGAE